MRFVGSAVAIATAFVVWSPAASSQPEAPPVDEPAPPTEAAPEPTPPAAAPAPPPPPAEEATPPAAAKAPDAPVAKSTPAPREPAKSEPRGFGGVYVAYFDKKLEELLSLPLWGSSTQLPAGVFKIRYEYNPATASTFYDRDGNEVPLLPELEFPNTNASGGTDTFFIQPRVKGKGAGHTFQFGYGISDPLDVFVELPFTVISTDLKLGGEVLEDGAQDRRPITDIERAGFEAVIEENGRPLPGKKFRGDMDLGDVILGYSWNYHRTEHFSTAVVQRVFLPTGHPASPNNDLSFLLGPEIDRGMGAWATNVTQVFDVRPWEYTIFSFEITAGYRFAYERDAPKFLPIRFCRRVEDPVKRAQVGCDGPTAPPYDPVVDRDQGAILPDLEGLADTYTVEPAINVDALAAITIEPGVPVPIQVGWQFQRSEAQTIRAKGTNGAGARFEALSKELALFEASELHTLGVGIQLPLFPLYVPISAQISTRIAMAGKNSIILKDNYSFAFELYLPLGDLWMEPRKVEPKAD